MGVTEERSGGRGRAPTALLAPLALTLLLLLPSAAAAGERMFLRTVARFIVGRTR